MRKFKLTGVLSWYYVFAFFVIFGLAVYLYRSFFRFREGNEEKGETGTGAVGESLGPQNSILINPDLLDRMREKPRGGDGDEEAGAVAEAEAEAEAVTVPVTVSEAGPVTVAEAEPAAESGAGAGAGPGDGGGNGSDDPERGSIPKKTRRSPKAQSPKRKYTQYKSKSKKYKVGDKVMVENNRATIIYNPYLKTQPNSYYVRYSDGQKELVDVSLLEKRA